MFYNYFSLDYSTCTNTETTQTNGVYWPIELVLLLIEGSWVVTKHTCFHSPGDQSLMSLCLWHLQWWFSWSLMWVFTSAPPLSSSSLPLYPPLWSEGHSSQSSFSYSHMWLSCLILFFEPYIGCQNCVMPSAYIMLFTPTHSLPFDSLSHILLCHLWVPFQN